MNGWRRVRQRLARLWLKWRFLFFQQRRLNRPVVEWVAGRPFLVLPQVFNPALFLTSEFMAQALTANLIPPGARVLDMGTGSGVGAVFAAQWAAQVTAVDVNPAAVRCTQINALLNQVEGCVEARQGDLFAAVTGETFDLILFNPPYLQGNPQTELERAFYAEDVIERFTAELHRHLAPNGRALILLSSISPEDYFRRLFQQQGYQVNVAARQKLLTETLSLYELLWAPLT